MSGFPPAAGLPNNGLPFDPADPMAAIMAMQALGLPLPPLTGAGAPPGFNGGMPSSGGKTKIDARCRDYDTKGICERGLACPFNHGDNQVIVMPGQEGWYL